MDENRTRVVIIGGGYAGAVAANRLRVRRAHQDVDITLINARPHFVERIRLHQLITGSYDACVDYHTLLGRDVELVVDTVTEIDAAARTVSTASGGSIFFDYLIYAVGSGSGPLSVPGAAEFAYPISEFEQAAHLRAKLAALPSRAPVTVVGGGTTGIETASELAESGRDVTLVCGAQLGPYLSGPGRRSVARRLTKLGVTVLDGPGATAAAVRSNAVALADGRELPSTVTIWAAGFGVPDLARRSGLSTDSAGRLLTDETLTSIDSMHIVGAGDAVAPSDTPLRMSCQAAMPLGAQAANTVLSRIAGDQPASLNQAFTGQSISMGRNAGIIQLARTDDTALPLFVGGRPAAAIKEAVCRGTLSFLRREARRPGSYFWLRGGNRQQKPASGSSAARTARVR